MAFPVGAGLDKLAIGAGLDQIRGRPAVDKLLTRRNSGSSLRELDLRVGPVGGGVDKLAIGAGLDQIRAIAAWASEGQT